jgi:hypothetical protein
MRRPAPRTRDLLVVVLLIALALAWNRRRGRFLGLAAAHRACQNACDTSIAAMPRWWNLQVPRDMHSRLAMDHTQSGAKAWVLHKAYNPGCPGCLDDLKLDHQRAAEAYEAAAWYPWRSVPEGLVGLPDASYVYDPKKSPPPLEVPEDI